MSAPLNDPLKNISRIDLASLPTPVYKLNNLSSELGKEIYVKRDDLTGVETSGNKVRKLEFAVADALKNNADVLITCGGIQSNHCRATAAVAARLGLKSHLLLRIDDTPPVEGNYLLDKILGADITFVSRPDYSNRRTEIMEGIAEGYKEKGLNAYIIPEGASNGIGNFGYINAVKEAVSQEKELHIDFDAYVCAVGSGGTFTGLLLGTKFYAPDKKVIGFTVCDDRSYFADIAIKTGNDTLDLIGHKDIRVKDEDINIIDGYMGIGYAVSTDDELKLIRDAARKDGVILDPVYTGKAFRGLYNEIKKGNIREDKILFFHTGGLYGLFPKQDQLAWIV